MVVPLVKIIERIKVPTGDILIVQGDKGALPGIAESENRKLDKLSYGEAFLVATAPPAVCVDAIVEMLGGDREVAVAYRRLGGKA